MRLLIMCVLLVGLTACGNGEPIAKDEHVWKDQTKALNKAKEVEQMLMDSAKQRLQKSND